MSSHTQAATVALSETGGMNDESERRQGMWMSKEARAKLICTTGRESPPRERKLLPPQLHHGPLCRAEAKALDCRGGSGSTPPKPHFPPSLDSAPAATGGSSRQQVRSSSRSGLLRVSPLFRKAQQPWDAPPGSSSRSRPMHPAASELRLLCRAAAPLHWAVVAAVMGRSRSAAAAR